MAKNDEQSEASKGRRIAMLTANRMGWKKEDIQELVLNDRKAEHDLFHVVGTITAHAVKESKSYEGRESVEFRGSFLGINISTGERFTSSRLYLPGQAEADVAGLVASKGVAQIACTITAIYAEKSPASYVYGVKWHGEEDTSGFDALLEKIPGLKALPPGKGGGKKK